MCEAVTVSPCACGAAAGGGVGGGGAGCGAAFAVVSGARGGGPTELDGGSVSAVHAEKTTAKAGRSRRPDSIGARGTAPGASMARHFGPGGLPDPRYGGNMGPG